MTEKLSVIFREQFLPPRSRANILSLINILKSWRQIRSGQGYSEIYRLTRLQFITKYEGTFGRVRVSRLHEERNTIELDEATYVS